MSLLLTSVLAVLAVPLGFALLVFSAELLGGILPLKASGLPSNGPRKVAVLMPAHNEAKVIVETVEAVLARLEAGAILLVVADNCSDGTADLARGAGAQVVERFDEARRGKGYALAHGVAALRADPPDCVIVLDADSLPEDEALSRLADKCLAAQRPVQACYVLRPGPHDGPVTRISNFAFMLKNRVRQRGMSRLAGTCMLTGSGMAFPWAVIARQDLANGEIVEDLVLGLRLALAGDLPQFVDDACIVSRPAPSDADTQGQRRRWEHGFLAAAVRFSPSLVGKGVARRRFALLWMGFHLVVPPFVMLLSLSAVVWGLLVLACWSGSVPAVLPAGLGVAICLTLTLLAGAWQRFGRAYLGLRDLLVLPRYLVAKVGIWAGLVTRRHATWNRTER